MPRNSEEDKLLKIKSHILGGILFLDMRYLGTCPNYLAIQFTCLCLNGSFVDISGPWSSTSACRHDPISVPGRMLKK